MTEYIDRMKLIADMEKRYCEPCVANKKDYNGAACRACWVNDAIGEVDDAPLADVAPVAHGKWIRHKPEGVIFADYECSVCSAYPTGGIKSYYCPNCGAKMDY